MLLIHFVCATSNHFSSYFWQVFDDYFTLERELLFVEIPNNVHKGTTLLNTILYIRNSNERTMSLFTIASEKWKTVKYVLLHGRWDKFPSLYWHILNFSNNISVKGIICCLEKFSQFKICHNNLLVQDFVYYRENIRKKYFDIFVKRH